MAGGVRANEGAETPLAEGRRITGVETPAIRYWPASVSVSQVLNARPGHPAVQWISRLPIPKYNLLFMEPLLAF
jgi:hypothetical protein